jgi:hypothetical protein
VAEGGQHGVIQKIILLQAAHVFVGFLAKEHYVQVINAKPLPTVRESELRPRTSVNAAIGRLQGFLVLNQDSTETLARLAARKADGGNCFE